MLNIIMIIVIVGILLYLLNVCIPMEATIQKILNIVVITSLIVWLLKVFGIWGQIKHL